jgi:alpha-ketoglutarate-dependent taurine dioxygenase
MEVAPYGRTTVGVLAVLGDTMQDMLEPLKVHMSGRRILAALKNSAAPGAQATFASMDIDPKERELIEGSYHRLIRTDPVTGERSLYVDESYTVGIQGLSDYEATPVIEFLCRHITQPFFTCRLLWEQDTFVLWDNRSCIHHAFNDHDGFRREMLRTIVAGEIPA